MTAEEITQHYHFSTATEGYCASCLAKACKENPENPYARKLEENLTATWAVVDSPMGFFNHPELQQVSSKLSRRDICQCHQQILDAVKAGDPVQAYLAVMAHAALMHQVGP